MRSPARQQRCRADRHILDRHLNIGQLGHGLPADGDRQRLRPRGPDQNLALVCRHGPSLTLRHLLLHQLSSGDVIKFDPQIRLKRSEDNRSAGGSSHRRSGRDYRAGRGIGQDRGQAAAGRKGPRQQNQAQHNRDYHRPQRDQGQLGSGDPGWIAGLKRLNRAACVDRLLLGQLGAHCRGNLGLIKPNHAGIAAGEANRISAAWQSGIVTDFKCRQLARANPGLPGYLGERGARHFARAAQPRTSSLQWQLDLGRSRYFIFHRNPGL